MQQVQLQVDDEVKALADAVAGLAADIKAKAGVIQDATDFLAKLVPAMASLQNVGVDVKKAGNQAYILYAILAAFEPA